MQPVLLAERQDWYNVTFLASGEKLITTRVWAPSASNALEQGLNLRPIVTQAHNQLVKNRRYHVRPGQIEVRVFGTCSPRLPIKEAV